MRIAFSIAKNTLREFLHEKYLHFLFALSICFLLFSLVLGELTLDEREKLIVDLSLMMIEVIVCFLSIFVGATFLHREIEKQTCLLVLARQVSRLDFILGKCLGGLSLLFIFTSVLMGLLVALVRAEISSVLLIMTSIYAKTFICLFFAFFMSLIVRPVLAIASGLALYFFCHWITDLQFLAKNSEQISFKVFAEISKYIFPRFDLYNWKDYFHWAGQAEVGHLGFVIGQFFVWSFLFFVVAHSLWKKKDLI